MKSLLVLFVAMALFATGEALKCYGCMSPKSGCTDPFDKSAIETTTCSAIEVCVKQIADLSNGTSLAMRGCAPPIPVNLQYALDRATPNITLVRMSMDYCNTDRCNGVSVTSAALSMLMVLAVPFVFGNLC